MLTCSSLGGALALPRLVSRPDEWPWCFGALPRRPLGEPHKAGHEASSDGQQQQFQQHPEGSGGGRDGEAPLGVVGVGSSQATPAHTTATAASQPNSEFLSSDPHSVCCSTHSGSDTRLCTVCAAGSLGDGLPQQHAHLLAAIQQQQQGAAAPQQAQQPYREPSPAPPHALPLSPLHAATLSLTLPPPDRTVGAASSSATAAAVAATAPGLRAASPPSRHKAAVPRVADALPEAPLSAPGQNAAPQSASGSSGAQAASLQPSDRGGPAAAAVAAAAARQRALQQLDLAAAAAGGGAAGVAASLTPSRFAPRQPQQEQQQGQQAAAPCGDDDGAEAQVCRALADAAQQPPQRRPAGVSASAGSMGAPPTRSSISCTVPEQQASSSGPPSQHAAPPGPKLEQSPEGSDQPLALQQPPHSPGAIVQRCVSCPVTASASAHDQACALALTSQPDSTAAAPPAAERSRLPLLAVLSPEPPQPQPQPRHVVPVSPLPSDLLATSPGAHGGGAAPASAAGCSWADDAVLVSFTDELQTIRRDDPESRQQQLKDQQERGGMSAPDLPVGCAGSGDGEGPSSGITLMPAPPARVAAPPHKQQLQAASAPASGADSGQRLPALLPSPPLSLAMLSAGNHSGAGGASAATGGGGTGTPGSHTSLVISQVRVRSRSSTVSRDTPLA